MNHASLGTLAQTGARPAVAVATHLLAERTSGAWKPSLITSFAAVSAAATAATFTTSCEGAEALSGLKNIRDAKEIVLYQYAVCPFCNKVRGGCRFRLLRPRAESALNAPPTTIFRS